MIKVENLKVYNMDGAVRGMRNPHNSWRKSDSGYGDDGAFKVGQNDLELMRDLYRAGPEHAKFMRQIFVSVDITAPLYWWKEFDTYKVGTTSNSCSTMHKLHSRDLTIQDFSCEHLNPRTELTLLNVIGAINSYRREYVKSKDKNDWWQMIQLLPSSYNQKRTVTMSYANLANMIEQRENHKLDEWQKFCRFILSYGRCPYLCEIIKWHGMCSFIEEGVL